MERVSDQLKSAAQVGLAFLNRASFQGQEADAFMAARDLLSGIVQGRYDVTLKVPTIVRDLKDGARAAPASSGGE